MGKKSKPIVEEVEEIAEEIDALFEEEKAEEKPQKQAHKPKDRSVVPIEHTFFVGDKVNVKGIEFEVKSYSGEEVVLKRVDFK